LEEPSASIYSAEWQTLLRNTGAAGIFFKEGDKLYVYRRPSRTFVAIFTDRHTVFRVRISFKECKQRKFYPLEYSAVYSVEDQPTFRLHLQGGRIRQARNQHESRKEAGGKWKTVPVGSPVAQNEPLVPTDSDAAERTNRRQEQDNQSVLEEGRLCWFRTWEKWTENRGLAWVLRKRKNGGVEVEKGSRDRRVEAYG
jgi:hypothetical protein